MNKLPELYELLYSDTDKFDVLCITETWLHCGVTSGLLDPHSAYSVLRKDRNASKRGGGVAAFIARGVNYVTVNIDESFADLEVLCFDLIFTSSKVRFFIVYRPPGCDLHGVEYVRSLIRCLNQYSARDHVNVIVGDFNCPKINWLLFTTPSDPTSSAVFDWAVSSGFTQHVDFPTRGQNSLDLVFTDDDQIISRIVAQPPAGFSDHCIVDFVLTIEHSHWESNVSAHPATRYNWHIADFDMLKHHLLAIDWTEVICCNPCAKSAWSAFEDLIWEAVVRCVPSSSSHRKSSKNKRHPRKLRKLVTKKRRLWKEHRSNPSDLNALWRYRDCVHQYRVACRDAVLLAEESVIQADNLGAFYKHVNQRVRHRDAIAALTDDDGLVVTSDVKKADMFNEYFASVGVADNGKSLQNVQVVACKTLESVTFNEHNILFAMRKLKPNLSSGPDGLPPLLFKKLQYVLATPLALVFTQLFSVGVIPDIWKQAVIVPVFKKGATCDVANYRPISLTCVASKIMERVIVQQILHHLYSNKLLSVTQHGFIKGRSTCTNLLEALNDWTLSIQNKKSVSIAYIDFSRAFDSVSHDKLFACLHAYGIRGDLLCWLRNFFIGRTHKTKIGVSLSAVAALLTGVIQGSGIGPMMFVIYIDDLAKLLERHGIKAKLFADDVKVYVEIDDPSDSWCLQRTLDMIGAWADEWQLSLSVSKCNILTVGNACDGMHYCLSGARLPQGNTARDLGITISSDLSPSQHISEIVLKAHQRSNHIIRCFVSGNTNSLVRAFCVYVRPLLEFNSVVWSPTLIKDIDLIEQVQRRFTKRLRGFKDITYPNRLQRLKLLSLELRRLHLDLIYCYKIVFGLVCVNFDDLFKFSTITHTRGHCYKLYKSRCTSTVRKNFFAERVTNVWNYLPQSVDFSSLTKFKQSLFHVDFSAYVRYM